MGRLWMRRGDIMRSAPLFFLLCACAHSATLYRIAAGSQGGTDPAGNVWQADAYYTGGARWTASNQPALSSQPVPYQAVRYGAAFSYSLPAAAGTYSVILGFAEIRTATSSPPIAAGQRLFSVSINGAVVQSSLDIFAAAGSLTPYSLTFPVTTTGPITITLTSITGNAVLSSIQVDSVDAPPPPAMVPYFTGLESAPPVCPQSLALLYTTDTNRLLWCMNGGTWHYVGDVLNGGNGDPQPPQWPQLVQMDQCSGTGAQWDCTGMYRAILRRENGDTMSLVGIDMNVSSGAYPPVTWVTAK